MHAIPPADPMTDLEARQDDLLRRLDELNAQVEQVLAEFNPRRPAAHAGSSATVG
jgi:hypothetical protein